MNEFLHKWDFAARVLWSSIIDGLILIFITSILIALYISLSEKALFSNINSQLMAVLVVAYLVNFLRLIKDGKLSHSYGKYLSKLIIVDEKTGRPADFRICVRRNELNLFPFFPLALLILFNKKTPGDNILHTKLRKEENPIWSFGKNFDGSILITGFKSFSSICFLTCIILVAIISLSM